MTLFLDPTLKPHFAEELCVFEHMMSLQGEVFRHQEGRKTQRITINGQYYFIKQHSGIGWKEIFKHLIALRRPVLSAYAEQRALQQLQQLGIDVPQVLAYGWQFNYN